MTIAIGEGRLFSIVIRSQRLGYAILDGSNRLLDWGVVPFLSNSPKCVAAARMRVVAHLSFFDPSVVVIGKTRLLNVYNAAGLRSMSKSIRSEVVARMIPYCVLKKTDLLSAFRAFRAKSKSEIASVVAQLFPELQSRLPPPRKIWESEHPRMIIFDAVAQGFAYWQHSEPSGPTEE